MDGFTADTDGMRAGGRLHEDVHQLLAELYGAHAAELDAIGNCWGDDEPGRAFHQAYVPSAVETLRRMHPNSSGSATNTYGVLAENVYRWARGYDDTEAAVTATTPRIESV